MLGQEAGAIDADDGLDLVKLVEVKVFPYAVGRKEYRGFRVVDDMLGIDRVEVGQDRDDNGSIGDGGHIDRDPCGIVFADEGHFVALLEATLVEEDMSPGDPAGEVAVSHGGAAGIVGYSREVPVFAKRLGIELEEVFFHHGIGNCEIVKFWPTAGGLRQELPQK